MKILATARVALSASMLLGATTAGLAQTWTQRVTAARPSPRLGPGLAYDSARREGVLFGGTLLSTGGTAGENNETWVWNGAAWAQRFPATSPSARASFGMVYDSARGEVVLFGGRTTGVFFSETWVWNGTTWTQRFPATSPPRRANGQFMAYDAARQEVVLFGGTRSDGVSQDTWVWNGTTWTERRPAVSPPSRTQHAMAYDPLRRRVVVFSGSVLVNNGLQHTADTWEWDGSTWTEQRPATSPAGRFEALMAHDPALGAVVLFGGITSLTAVNDTWTWNGATWTRQASDGPPRYSYAMTTDAGCREVVLFGGWPAFSTSDQTWVWSASAPGVAVGMSASSSGSSVALRWSAPTCGGAPTSYIIEAGSTTGAADLANFPTGSAATSFSASGVGTGTYYVRVRASNRAGVGEASNEAVLTVGGSGCSAPGPPAGLRVVSVAGGTVMLAWEVPSGVPATYVVEAGSAPGLSDLASSDLGTNATTLTATGVGRGTYYVRMRGRNACGPGAPSNEVIVVVP